ncbi:MAG: hypothetical protein A2049_11435 [Elusimicrobia bacterium GWA2_62_23]|nr:MAG: hypothetical protein A2049_11435 [Elusimicrobia bacterium GWA2_62_23]
MSPKSRGKTFIAGTAVFCAAVAAFYLLAPQAQPVPPGDLRDAPNDNAAFSNLETLGGVQDLSAPEVSLSLEKSAGPASALRTADCNNVVEPSKEYAKRAAPPEFSKILGKTRLVLFSDVHDSAGVKVALTRLLPELKAAGITHLALEFLPSELQTDRMTPEEINRRLIRSGKWDMRPFERLVSAAKAAGLKVRGINVNGPEDTTRAIASARESMNAMDSYMTEQIMSILGKEPGARVMVLAGLAHVNPVYNFNKPTANTRIPGELIYRGVQKKDFRVIIIAARDSDMTSANHSMLGFLRPRKDLYLPMPQGIQPGCNPEYDPGSLLDGILYPKD